MTAIPSKARAAYELSERTAEHRGIEWGFTLESWWAWWQVDDRWSRRGLKPPGLVMCRIDDAMIYSPETVYAGTHRENMADRKLLAGTRALPFDVDWNRAGSVEIYHNGALLCEVSRLAARQLASAIETLFAIEETNIETAKVLFAKRQRF